MSGKVYLIGAGPGDPGLFTIKGKELLESADVVVYDALVGDAIIAMIADGAEKIYVGKRASNHALPQEEINKLLVELARAGKRTVRLKGGDPYLFGRGGEEMDSLIAEGIDFEVVPGISSSIAVPSYGGIPVTHRDFASSLHIITGHKREGEASKIDYESLLKLGGSYVFLMGLAAIDEICRGFLAAGCSKDMPVAVISKGCSTDQKTLKGRIDNISELVRINKIEAPAIIVIGQVVGVSEEFNWYERKPLFGRRLIITRPEGRSKYLAKRLADLGAEVIELPTIKTVPIKDNQLAAKAVKNISNYDYLLFTSPFGVECFFRLLNEFDLDSRSLSGCRIAVIGAATKKALSERGIIADIMPSEYSGRALGKLLASYIKAQDRLLILRAKEGNSELIEEIEKAGPSVVEDIALYETAFAGTEVDLRRLMSKGAEAVFTSSSTVKGFNELMEGECKGIKAYCIGKMTADEAREKGMKALISKEATMDSLIELIKEA